MEDGLSLCTRQAEQMLPVKRACVSACAWMVGGKGVQHRGIQHVEHDGAPESSSSAYKKDLLMLEKHAEAAACSHRIDQVIG
jgi:hypothetical protein